MIHDKFKSVNGEWLVLFPDNTRRFVRVVSTQYKGATWWSANLGGRGSMARTAHHAVCKVMQGIDPFAAFPPGWERLGV